MNRNIAIITVMSFLFAGISLGAQAADAKAPVAHKKHHVTHHKAAPMAKEVAPAEAPAK